MEKIEPKREKYAFDTMSNDELLGWWIFYKMDNGDVDIPPRIISVISDFRKFSREGVIDVLERNYN